MISVKRNNNLDPIVRFVLHSLISVNNIRSAIFIQAFSEQIYTKDLTSIVSLTIYGAVVNQTFYIFDSQQSLYLYKFS